MSLLTDEQCDEFRRLPVSFNDMVRAIHKAGHAAGRKAALLRAAERAHEYSTWGGSNFEQWFLKLEAELRAEAEKIK